MYEILRKLREEKGHSQTYIANYLGIQRQTYNHYECGRRTPDNSTLAKLADFYGVTVDYLIGREANTEKGLPDDWEAGLTEDQKAALNSKDRKDIAQRIADLRDDLANQNELYLSGEVLDDETRELLQAALENAVVISKVMAKQKYTPKKNK